MAEKEKVEATTPTSEASAPQKPDLAKVLEGFEGAPSTETVEEWKKVHGEVFISGFSDTELYIWRPLKRSEYRLMQQESQQSTVDQLDVEEKVVAKCTLWPLMNGDQNLKAGTYSALAQQIMENSNFLAPQVAAQLVIKL